MAAEGSSEAGPAGGMNVSDFSLEQLSGLKQQLEEEIKVLAGNLSQLRTAQARFKNSKDSLRELGSVQEGVGKEVLVPLTQSMYVPGRITNTKTVTVDIGTGYLVSKELPEATKFVERKIDFLEKNSNALEDQVLMKQQNLDSVVMIMKQKVAMVKQVSSN